MNRQSILRAFARSRGVQSPPWWPDWLVRARLAGIGDGEAPAFDPATLFASGEQGAAYDFTDESTLWQDTGRTTPVSTPGQKLYAADDLSGNDNHITRNAGTPRWQGEPATWGANLVTAPTDFSNAAWTKGTGCRTAPKTAGTASALEQAVSLTPGKTYMFVCRVGTRTAGTVKLQLTGGTTVTHFSGYNAAGEYIELLTAVSGNNTIGVQADSTFAGVIKAISVYEVTSFYDMGVQADFAERMLTGNINMSATNDMTIVVAMKRAARSANMLFAQVASAATGTGERGEWNSSIGFQGTAGAVQDTVTENDPNLTMSGNDYGIFAVRRDTNKSAIADQHVLQFNGIDLEQTNSGGPFATPTANSATSKISLLSWINNNSFFAGKIYRVVVINRRLTDEELTNAAQWCGFNGKFVVGGCTGDSTWASDGPPRGAGRGMTSYTINRVGAFSRMLPIEHWGDNTTEQNADWSALTSTSLSKLTAVHIAPGFNDVKGRVDNGASVPQILSDLQDYINEIAADCPNAVLVGQKLFDVDAWLDTASNPATCKAALDAWNTALTDGTITGLDAVADAHLDLMNDGSGTMPALMNTGINGDPDGVHPGELGRLCMGVAARQAYVSLGKMTAARSFEPAF